MRIRIAALLISLCLAAGCVAVADNMLPPPTEPTVAQSRPSKKGCCLTTRKQNQDNWQAKVAALRVSWHYSWGAKLPAAEPPGVEFVPMIWGYWGASPEFRDLMGELTVQPSSHSSQCLLGFNEPDGKDQANMSVERALEAWPYLMQTGRRLGSPAAVHADSEWMQDFMRVAREKEYRVDFVCVHWYGGPNADNLIKRLNEIHALYGKPIWITEFAVADWKADSRQDNRHSPATVLRFMREVLPRLDDLDFVERYAWFSAAEDDRALGPSALFTPAGSLTELGECYAAHEAAATSSREPDHQ